MKNYRKMDTAAVTFQVDTIVSAEHILLKSSETQLGYARQQTYGQNVRNAEFNLANNCLFKRVGIINPLKMLLTGAVFIFMVKLTARGGFV